MSNLLALLNEKKAKLDSGNRAKTLKLKTGRNRWRLLPGWRKDSTKGDPEQFWHDFGQHFIKGLDEGTGKEVIKAVYICTDKTFGKPCPVCDTVHSAMNSASDEMKELIKQSIASNRVLLNVLDREGDKPNEAQICEVPPGVFSQIVAIMQEWGPTEVLDPSTGRDFIIERTGSGLNTKYSVTIAAKSEAVPAAVLGKLPDIDAYCEQENAADQQRALANLRSVAGLLSSPAPTNNAALLASVSVAPVSAHAEVPVTSTVVTAASSEPEPAPSLEDADALDSVLADLV